LEKISEDKKSFVAKIQKVNFKGKNTTTTQSKDPFTQKSLAWIIKYFVLKILAFCFCLWLCSRSAINAT
jgi:hypothetical protein